MLCRDAVEKVVGSIDDKTVLGVLDLITGLKVRPLAAAPDCLLAIVIAGF